jgi:hypothetical protein
MSILIGLAGARGVGKSYLANRLNRELGFHEIKFAQPVMDMASDLCGEYEYEIYHKKSIGESFLVGEQPVNYRELMHMAGRLLEYKGFDFIEYATKQAHGHERVVISDIRLDIEMGFVLCNFGHVFEVTRDGCLYTNQPFDIKLDGTSPVDYMEAFDVIEGMIG